MKEMIIQTRGILTGGESPRWIPKGLLLIRDGRIVDLLKRSTQPAIDLSDRIAIPGFVQTHVHLCQTHARGLADDLSLLQWLKDRIMPFEASLSAPKLRASVRQGICELISSGTTSIMDMGTVRHTDVIGQEMLASGIRGYFGKCLMDQNDLFPPLREETDQAMEEAYRLAKKWHLKENRLRWSWAPRFALTCSDQLMQQSHSLLNDFPQTLFHTHASENLAELSTICQKHGMRNIEYLESLGLLSDNSCLAHCVHLSENEIQLLQSRHCSVLHCPSANLKLASGIADIVEYRKRGIPVSIGTDGAACNNRMDAWNEMRLASLLQKLENGPAALSARETFLMATWEGAKALHWDSDIGSLERGKIADIVFANLPKETLPRGLRNDTDCYNALVYSGGPELVTDVMIGGNWVKRRNVLKYPLL